VLIDWDYGEDFQHLKQEGKLNLVELNSERQGFLMVSSGRLDAFIHEQKAGYYYLDKHLPQLRQKIAHAPTPLDKTSYRLLISKQTEDAQRLIDAFNTGLQHLNDLGLVDQLINESLQQ